ncbi:MAG: DUF3293 domain-containing protein [Mycobacterium sp.]|nr:DUF3293 domain-containing protein [Mycobacterium sp.]
MATYSEFEWVPLARLAELARGNFPWNYYLATEVQFEGGIVRPVEDGDCQIPPFGTLHVVSAIQPESDPGTTESAARMGVLDRELAVRGLCAVPVVGASLDGTYCEDSRAIFGLTNDEARTLGADFGQVAVFAWCGPWWSVLACGLDRSAHSRWRWTPSNGLGEGGKP